MARCPVWGSAISRESESRRRLGVVLDGQVHSAPFAAVESGAARHTRDRCTDGSPRGVGTMVGMWSAGALPPNGGAAGVDGTLDHPGVRLVGPGDGAGDQRRRWAARTPATHYRRGSHVSARRPRTEWLYSGVTHTKPSNLARLTGKAHRVTVQVTCGERLQKADLDLRWLVEVFGRRRLCGHHVLTVATVEFEAVGVNTEPSRSCLRARRSCSCLFPVGPPLARGDQALQAAVDV